MKTLLLIYPVYANQILAGTKKVEFRKKIINTNSVVMFVTDPVKKAIGEFSIFYQCIASPRELWERYHECGGIELEDFNNYYHGWSYGVGILIKDVIHYSQPRSLDYYGLDTEPKGYIDVAG